MRPLPLRLVCRIAWGAILGMLWSNVSKGDEVREIERQTREFQVSVDGTERGRCTMRICRHDDGTEKVAVDATIRVDFLVYRYTYLCAGTEVWKNDRLVELENTADYNGTQYAVTARRVDEGLRVSVNGKTLHVAHDAWTTSYWRMPERLKSAEAVLPDAVVTASASEPASGAASSRKISLLDSNRGRALRGELQRVGDETLRIAGKRVRCVHYRVRGDVQADLWYDGDCRLVRQNSLDDGHKTQLLLTKVAAE